MYIWRGTDVCLFGYVRYRSVFVTIFKLFCIMPVNFTPNAKYTCTQFKRIIFRSVIVEQRSESKE